MSSTLAKKKLEKSQVNSTDKKHVVLWLLCTYVLLLTVLFMLLPMPVNAQSKEEKPTALLPTIERSQLETLSNDERVIELPDTIPTDLDSLSTQESFEGVYGSISSVGSDTLATLISLWSERFKTAYPHVKFQIQASGSATAPQALTQGTATIGPMSRAMTASEISRFTQKHGYPPTTLIVAVDAIAIYVEKNNPIASLTLKQIDALFSETRFCGSSMKIKTWTDIGVSKFGDERKVLLYGRNSASGTYDLFKEQALCEGDFKATVNELPGSSSVVLSIASSVGGLGYAAIGRFDENVKALSVGIQTQGEMRYVEPNIENITTGTYPFSRYLYIVVNKPPNEPLPVLERAFLTFILSEEGQKMVSENGYYSVTKNIRDKQLASIMH